MCAWLDLVLWTPTGSWRAGAALLECVSAFISSRWKQFHTKRTQHFKTVPKVWKTGAKKCCWVTQQSARAVCPQLSRICSHHMDVLPPGPRQALKTLVLSCLKTAQLFRWCVWLSHPCVTSKIYNDVIFSFCSVIQIPKKLDGYSNSLEFYLLFFKLKVVLFLIIDNSSLIRQGGECWLQNMAIPYWAIVTTVPPQKSFLWVFGGFFLVIIRYVNLSYLCAINKLLQFYTTGKPVSW